MRWLSLLLVLALACAGGPSQALRVETADEGTIAALHPAGAIVVGGQRVATVSDAGKVTARDGTLVAFVHEKRIRLRGGAEIPIREDESGALFLQEKAQIAAGLEPVKARVRPDGSLEGGGLLRLHGASDPRSRRLALLLLVILENDLVRYMAAPSPSPRRREHRGSERSWARLQADSG